MQLRGMDHSADGSEGMRSTPDNVEYAGRGRPSFARAWVQLLRLLLVMISAACTAVSAVAGDEQDCFQGREPELRIRGCSQLIQRAPADATAYHNRAVAYGLAGDLDKAIADYTKVIELAPSNASAYENRGRAYASRGDYTRAVEDETKAHELMAKAMAQPTGSTSRAPKTPKSPPPPKAKTAAPPNNKVAKEPADTSWWSWLNPSPNSPTSPAAKKAKP
jgi:tetratricopeptide (TPR) repeat protein